MAAGRAVSLSRGPTASSRSAQTTSAPAESAFGNISGFEAGTNSRLRHGLILRAFTVLLELSGQIIGVLLLLSRSTSLRRIKPMRTLRAIRTDQCSRENQEPPRKRDAGAPRPRPLTGIRQSRAC